MGSAVLEFMADNDYTPHVERIGVPDAFIEHGTVQELHRLCGMDEEGIYNILIKNEELMNEESGCIMQASVLHF